MIDIDDSHSLTGLTVGLLEVSDCLPLTPTDCILGQSDSLSNKLSEYDLASSPSECHLFPQIPIVGSETAVTVLVARQQPDSGVSQSRTSPEGFLDDSLYQPHRVSKLKDRKTLDLPEGICYRATKDKSISQPNGLTKDILELSKSPPTGLAKAFLDRSKSHPNGLTRILVDKSGSHPNGLTRAILSQSDSGSSKQIQLVTCDDSQSNGFMRTFLDKSDSQQSIDGLLEESVVQLNRITEDILGDSVL